MTNHNTSDTKIAERKGFLAFGLAFLAICVAPSGISAIINATTTPVAFSVEAL